MSSSLWSVVVGNGERYPGRKIPLYQFQEISVCQQVVSTKDGYNKPVKTMSNSSSSSSSSSEWTSSTTSGSMFREVWPGWGQIQVGCSRRCTGSQWSLLQIQSLPPPFGFFNIHVHTVSTRSVPGDRSHARALTSRIYGAVATSRELFIWDWPLTESTRAAVRCLDTLSRCVGSNTQQQLQLGMSWAAILNMFYSLAL